MREVFADALYWIATVKPNDPYASAAAEARQAIGPCVVVTPDEVLGEFVTAFSKGGSKSARAVRTVKRILDNRDVRVVAQSRESFLRAIDRFANRPDKQYSLTDCSSMNAMDAEGIKDVLTNDHHFEQEGYNAVDSPLTWRRRWEILPPGVNACIGKIHQWAEKRFIMLHGQNSSGRGTCGGCGACTKGWRATSARHCPNCCGRPSTCGWLASISLPTGSLSAVWRRLRASMS